MQRRKALTLIALGGVSPALAFAQGGGREAGGNLDDATRRYMQNTLEIGSVALATSRIAQQRARDPWVRKFASFEISEQEGVAKVFTSLGAQAPAKERTEEQDAVRQLQNLPRSVRSAGDSRASY